MGASIDLILNYNFTRNACRTCRSCNVFCTLLQPRWDVQLATCLLFLCKFYFFFTSLFGVNHVYFFLQVVALAGVSNTVLKHNITCLNMFEWSIWQLIYITGQVSKLTTSYKLEKKKNKQIHNYLRWHKDYIKDHSPRPHITKFRSGILYHRIEWEICLRSIN